MFSIRFIQLFLFTLCTLGVGLLLVAICIEIDVINVVVFNWYKITKARGSKYMTDHRNKYDKYNRYLVTLVVLMCFVLVEFLSPLGQVSASKGKFYVKDGVLTKYWGQESKVVIPDGVKEIGYEAFQANPYLKEVSIPKSVKKISRYAFMSCYNLTKINWNEGIEEIEFHAFRNCNKLKDIKFPKSIKYIGGRAFEGTAWMNKKKGFVIVNNILIQYNGKKKSITVPDGVKQISGFTFYDKFTEDKSWNGPVKVNLPNTIIELDEDAFNHCTDLREIQFNSEVEEIPDSCFNYCTSLKKINIPNSVKRIGAFAFTHCTSLEEIALPKELRRIEDMAFGWCELKHIELPSKLDYIENLAFTFNDNIKSITIPKYVKTIDSGAFEYCYNLEYIEFLSKKTIVENDAFGNTSWLEKQNDEFIIVNDCLINYNGKSKSVIIPESVKYLNYMFDESIKDVTLPNGLVHIGGGAFSRTKIEKITIPKSVVSIGDYAFGDLKNIEKIVIPDNVKTIGKNAFSGCKNLRYIKLPKKLKSITEDSFSFMSDVKIVVGDDTKIKLTEGNGDSTVKFSKITIACKKDSPAYKYAKKRGCKIKLQ